MSSLYISLIQLAVNYLDRLPAAHQSKATAIACLSLAASFLDAIDWKSDDLELNLSLKKQRSLVLSSLEWNLNVPTALDFLHLWLKFMAQSPCPKVETLMTNVLVYCIRGIIS